MSMYELRYGIAWTRSRMVAPVSRRTRRPSVPASGLASMARILSCRSVARVGAERGGRRGLADAALEADDGDPVAGQHRRADQLQLALPLGLLLLAAELEAGRRAAGPAALRLLLACCSSRSDGQLHGRGVTERRAHRGWWAAAGRAAWAAARPRRCAGRPGAAAGSAAAHGGGSRSRRAAARMPGRRARTSGPAGAGGSAGRGAGRAGESRSPRARPPERAGAGAPVRPAAGTRTPPATGRGGPGCGKP